jgi:L-rhamnose mutarotase
MRGKFLITGISFLKLIYIMFVLIPVSYYFNNKPTSMIRNAFTMKLKPGFEAEYKKRHDQIWPELAKALTEAGVHEYTIFLDEETSTLFAFQKLTDNNTANQLPDHPVLQKWWKYMADIMETNPDYSPLTARLKEVFHMD